MMDTHEMLQALAEREREARRAAEELLERKSAECYQTQLDWLVLMGEVEQGMLLGREQVRQWLVECLAQELTGLRFLLPGIAVEEAQARLSDLQGLVLRFAQQWLPPEGMGLPPSVSGLSQEALARFEQHFPVQAQPRFHSLILRMMYLWPLWDDREEMVMRVFENPETVSLEVAGNRIAPLASQAYAGLLRAELQALGNVAFRFEARGGRLVVLLRMKA